jgi:phosphoglucosamine mutase
MPGKLFGSSGIRGVFGKEVTPELGLALGQALGSRMKRVVVGWDVRTTSPLLASSAAAGLMSCGCDVGLVGMVPTPTLARAAASADAGVMVTASHNPPEFNGFKLWNPDGMAFDVGQSDAVEERLTAGGFKASKWDSIGDTDEVSDAIPTHINAIISSVGRSEARVTVDCGNGAASVVSPYLLREMGCEVAALNADPDGAFPGRGSEPLDEKLGVLKKIVASSGASVGIAHDGDADRFVAVDEGGRFLDGDLLLPLLAKLEARKSIVVPVDASMAIDEYLDGTKVHRCKVGDVHVAEAIKRHGADFGGEPSGTFIFPRETYCPDGIYAAAKLVALASETKISELAAEIPRYPMMKERVPYDVSKRASVGKKLLAGLERTKPNEMQTLDGARATYDEGWILIRPSGTEPKVKIVVEAKDKGSAKALFKLARAIVTGAIR